MTMQIIILAAVVVGILLIVLSLIFFRQHSMTGDGLADNTVKAIDASISEMDKTMEEFNELSKSIFEEIDARYQELLFLYSLIDDKKTAIDKIYKAPPPAPVPVQQKQSEPAEIPRSKSAEAAASHFQSHPKRDEIIHLRKQGIPVAEIAKQLDMGQGEVKLIIELEKAR